MELNEEIIDFIGNDKDIEDKVKKILIEALNLELKRYKSDYPFYYNDYDKILTHYLDG